ncbi:MAG: peptidogalycan biosysnthesis protein [Chitinophagaceae bacterium]
MITLKKYNSIHDVDPVEWNSILDDHDIFHRHSFLSAVEDSRVENATLSYLLFYDGDVLTATTVFSIFSISLDLFTGDSRIVKALKKVFPKLFSIRILVCGLPASFGQQNLKLTDDAHTGAISRLIAAEMRGVAKQQRIKFMAVKELERHEATRLNGLEKEGFFLTHSIPYMQLPVRWNSFQNYLSSLRHPYRRRILQALKKAGCTEPVILSPGQYDGEGTAWVVAPPGENFAGDFFPAYLRVMERTPVKLETLNKAFFEQLQQRKEEYEVLHFIVNGNVISTGVLVSSGDILTFMLVGRENEKDPYDSYVNLVYGIVALAIQRGVRQVKLGQTAYWVKSCIGGLPEDEFLYFACTKPVTHWLLKKLRAVLFPETKLKPIHVFRQQDHVAEMQEVHA